MNTRQTEERRSSVHGCLKHRHRRYVLYRLKHGEREQSLADLAEYVAKREPRGTEEIVDDVHRSLYHVHVPKLAAADLVEWGPDDEMVALVEYPDGAIDERTLAEE